MLTHVIIYSTFLLKIGDTYCTGFSFDVDGRQYLVTARHCVEGLQDKDEIGIRISEWPDDGRDVLAFRKLGVVIVGRSDGDADIAVLSPEYRISNFSIPVGSFRMGEDALVAGFPLPTSTNFQSKMKVGNKYVAPPLAKKTVVAGYNGDDERIILDTISNPGFSGSPILVENDNEWTLIGVMSGNINLISDVYAPVYGEEGRIVGKTPTGFKVDTPAGISVATRIKIALDIIQSNPIGLNLSESE